MTSPLESITVVTLEQAIAGPFCSRQLADLGAWVINVERPGTGNLARGYDEQVKGLASHFVWTNRSKESLTLGNQAPLLSEKSRVIPARGAKSMIRNKRAGRRDYKVIIGLF